MTSTSSGGRGRGTAVVSMVNSASPVISGGSSTGLSTERLLEVAHATGELILTGRNLKTFPKHRCKFDLKDTVYADLSRNKLTELPQECTDYCSLEKLVLYHNAIRSIPDSIVFLQSLRFLDLSRNQLSYLPASICELPLQALVVNNNRLVSLPEEIGKMQTLMELDASCNEITHLPVQIGDLGSLKVLNLRRNHLQEIPIEISYLQLTTLDLSGNRISILPNELRFMTTVICLNLGENPLTCPPANLCSRGRFHVFKYLEIQAIKEDRKRGVLTDNNDYRRSYRKTTAQLNDFRFASGFGADARRKRHTADSGYGSEQPLDRRWSQEFNQEADTTQQSNDDARRIIMRAANCQRSPRGQYATQASTEAIIRTRNLNSVNPTPLTSTGSTTSSTASSSGYGSITNENGGHHVVDYAKPNIPNRPMTVSVPSVSSGSSSTESAPALSPNGSRIIPIIKEKPTSTSQNGLTKSEVHLDSGRNGGESPDDFEKEERRRAAQRVLGKHGQLRQQPPEAVHVNGSQQQQPRLTASALARMQQLQSSSNIPESSATTRSLYDVKAMQKEAVLSYVKSKQGNTSPSRSVAGRGSQPDLQSNKFMTSNGRAASTTSIPQPSPTGSGMIKPLGKIKMNSFDAGNNYHRGNNNYSNPRRVDMEKSASADAHINQLRMEIESRLRITMPEDISLALADGVILCHIANHVRPRAVPSIHVPSPSVPKLTVAKCRRNVENFLLACRKIGVREENLFDWTTNMQPLPDLEAVEATLNALFALTCTPPDEPLLTDEDTIIDDDEETLKISTNYPDLVPRHAILPPQQEKEIGNLSETVFLLAVFLGTCLLLYIFPPEYE